ncbi:MAG: tRNA pseudouridine32 synthase/23S rRNA pseudouridine746 synthase [Vicingaceae bacterium]|jgi:tRNA pseudouridine32 synthase/23S rRNA pseudouridine746 synthase
MDNPLIFGFKTAISTINISKQLNNPFKKDIPEIAAIAAQEFQHFIAQESQSWENNFLAKKGKMFGVLVVQKKDETYGFLAAVSGKLPNNVKCDKLIPSIFNDSADDFFINRGMTELTEIGEEIKKSGCQLEIDALKKSRKEKSIKLQEQLFKNYKILNLFGIEKNVIEIFKDSSHGSPPSAAGECAAPKLLHHAFKQQLKPIALAEFWWGNLSENRERNHKEFYPACKNKCRPILEYMLDNTALFNASN